MWRPGATLAWYVVEDPEWQPTFRGASDVRPYIEEALSEWSAIPTADLRMRVDGVVQDEGRRGDGRNTIFVDGDASRAMILAEYDRARDLWEVVECDVGIADFAVEEILNPDDGRDAGLRHEFGHCLGLSHADGAPGIHDWQRQNAVGWQDPIMSKKRLTMRIIADDALGVSLLRPAPGWRETTGSLAGKVTVGGRAAGMMSVHLLRSENGHLRSDGVQVFTNGKREGAQDTSTEGVFRAEGLPAGDYLLWIRPPLKPRDTRRQVEQLTFFETDLNDLTVPRLFRVEAGRETWTGEFELQRGRNP